MALRRAFIKLSQAPPQLFLSRRHFSTKSHLVVINLSSPSPPPSSKGDEEALGIKKLEELIDRLVVLRHTPDWIPFLPGSSFWVPPRKTGQVSVGEMVNRLANPLNDEEELSLMRGWPSSRYFTQDGLPLSQDVFACSDKTYTSDEEEG